MKVDTSVRKEVSTLGGYFPATVQEAKRLQLYGFEHILAAEVKENLEALEKAQRDFFNAQRDLRSCLRRGDLGN